MKTKFLTSIICFLMANIVLAQQDVKQRLTELFKEGEHCYLIDDYQQLLLCINQFAELYMENLEMLGDSSSMFYAYYYKMCGAYEYGISSPENTWSAQYAERCYFTSLNVFKEKEEGEKSTTNIINIMVLHEELAQLYYKNKDYNKAYAHLDTVLTYSDQYDLIFQYYKTLSQIAICNARIGNYEQAIEQINEALDFYQKDKDAEYHEMLRKKGKILMLIQNETGVDKHKEAITCYDKYVKEQCKTIGLRLATMTEAQREQYWLSIHQFLYDCYRLGNYAPEFLYNLALFSKGYLIEYEHNKNVPQTQLKDVKKHLGKKDCAIEFVQYFGRHDEKRLGCLVVRNNSTRPTFIDLFSTDSLLSSPITESKTLEDALMSSSTNLKDTLYQSSQLPCLVWSPQVMKAIGDATKVYFSPDGLLHQWAIEYLMPDSGKVCYRLSSTRILTKKKTTPKLESALLCGGIKYGAAYQPDLTGNDIAAYRYLASMIRDTIKYLPGTLKEVDSIYFYRNQPQDTLVTGNSATDEKFLRLLKRPYSIVHLSTHGYFGGEISKFTDIKPLLNDKPMSQSGVLFAGASNTLTNKFFNEDMYDGILSAEELSKQDLSKTELLILSACETGKGRITDDGLYGIQRGLKQAGANTLILSLWSVNDISTSLLMQYFYKNLIKQKEKDIHKAFLSARQQLINYEETIWIFDPATFTTHQKKKKYNLPQHVNPFIIIDAY